MLNTLIVEDNATYRQSLRHLLAGRFPEMLIAEAADAEEALRQALSRRFDLIFTDIRLPHGNGLSLTKTIKTDFADSMVCVITSHDILEYREAAFQNGADYFMVKGESTEAEIIDLVESWLRARFITLIIVSDALYRKQLAMLLSIHWPVMIVAEAENLTEAIGKATTLRPNLVLLDLGLANIHLAELVRELKTVSEQARFIGMTTDDLQAYRARALGCGVDYCVPLDPAGHTELVTILNALHTPPVHH